MPEYITYLSWDHIEYFNLFKDIPEKFITNDEGVCRCRNEYKNGEMDGDELFLDVEINKIPDEESINIKFELDNEEFNVKREIDTYVKEECIEYLDEDFTCEIHVVGHGWCRFLDKDDMKKQLIHCKNDCWKFKADKGDRYLRDEEGNECPTDDEFDWDEAFELDE